MLLPLCESQPSPALGMGPQGQPRAPCRPCLPCEGHRLVARARPRCATPNGLANRPASIIISAVAHAGPPGAARRGCGSLSQGPRSTASGAEEHLLQGSRPLQPSFTSHATLVLSARQHGREQPAASSAAPASLCSRLRFISDWLLRMEPLHASPSVIMSSGYKCRKGHDFASNMNFFGN